MDFEKIKAAAQAYQADMTRFLRDMISHPSESCEEREVVHCIKAEMEKLGYDKVEIDGLGNVIGWMGDGDKIIAIDGSHILSATDLIYKLQTTETDSYDVTVKRDGARVVVENVKFHNDNTDGLLDFAVEGKSKNPVNVVTYAAKDTAATAKLIWMSLVELVSGKYSLQDLSGPVGTVSVIEQAASSGENLLERVQSVMNLTIFITVNVGVFNLLPIPGLDGSRFVFLLIEAIRRKPVPKNREAMVHLIGMAALFLLMILVTVQDITRFFR